MARPRKSSKTSSVRVNFKGVESRKTPPEGDYVVKVLEAKNDTSSKGNDQIAWIFEIVRGEYKGVKLYFYTGLAENQLWALHALLTALGEDVPEDEMDIDLSDLVDRECVAVVTHETYNGKKRAKMTDFDSLDNYEGKDEDEDDDEDEDEKPSKKSKSKKPAKKPVDEDDDEEEKPARKSKKKPVDEDEDEDDDEDEDEKPSKKSKSKKPAKKKKTYEREEIEEMDEDELQEVIDEHDLDVDLDDFKKLAKKVSAVLDALEEEDLLDE